MIFEMEIAITLVCAPSQIFAKIRSLGSSFGSSVVSLLHSTQAIPKFSHSVDQLRNRLPSRKPTCHNWEKMKNNRPDGRAEAQELEFLTNNSVWA
jgi:hypothetical protein